jgi:hypothetical protein
MARLFISQEKLDAWTAEGKIDLDGDVMTLKDAGRSFAIKPAVRFVRVAGRDPDSAELVGTVKDDEVLAAMGADQYMNSVIVGDTAYDVECGFLGLSVPRGD